MQYIPLHGHSTFSFLEAIGTVKKIAEKAKKMELPAIAITDYNGMYGAVQFYNLAKELWFKPIIGVELGFVLDANNDYKTEQIGTICLLAKNNVWYHSLMKLVSFANTVWIANKPKIDLAILKEQSEGVIACMGGEQSRIGKMINNGEQESKITEIIGHIQERVGKENVYLEITAQDQQVYTALAKINPHILHIAQNMGIECIVNNNYFHINKKDRKAREAALSIKDNTKLYDPMRRKPSGKHHVMKAEEIIDICLANGYTQEQVDTRLANNMALAESIDTKIELGNTYFPNYDPPGEIKDMYERCKESLVE
jgi:DNA polymerase III subunit alpha